MTIDDCRPAAITDGGETTGAFAPAYAVCRAGIPTPARMVFMVFARFRKMLPVSAAVKTLLFLAFVTSSAPFSPAMNVSGVFFVPFANVES